MPGVAITLLFALALPGSTTVVAQRPAGGPDSVARGALVVHHWDAAVLATRLLDAVSAAPALPALPEDVLAADDPVHIFLAPDPARFDSLTGGEAPEWGAGIALPEASVIVLPAYASRRAAPGDLARILRHELAHIALHRYLAPAHIPRWFHEGYARWAAGDLDLEAGWQLRLAFLLGRAPPLDSLTLAWPASEAEARFAYLLSASTIEYLAQHGGAHGLGLFLARWKEEGELEPALWRTYGLQLPQFEEAWRRHVRRRYGWLVFFSHSAVFWAFAGVVLLALFGLRRRRDRVRLAQLRATEPPDEPAYWLEQAEAPDDAGSSTQGARQSSTGGEPTEA
ncbi:MAG TPA: hypothetical protein VIL18_13510 [Longimicrobiales bacterium]